MQSKELHVQLHLWAPSIVGICVLQRNRSPDDFCILLCRCEAFGLLLKLCVPKHTLHKSKSPKETWSWDTSQCKFGKHAQTQKPRIASIPTSVTQLQNLKKQSSISCSILCSLAYFIRFITNVPTAGVQHLVSIFTSY